MPSCFKFVCDKMRHLRGSTLRCIKATLVILIFALIIWYIICTFKRKVTPLYAGGVVEKDFGDITYDFSTGVFTLHNKHGIYLQGVLSEILRSTSTHDCRSKHVSSMCLNWIRYAHLEVTRIDDDSVVCHQITWTPTSKDFYPQDCFSLRGANWYGGSEMYTQIWPLQNAEVSMQPYVSNDILLKKISSGAQNIFGNVVERYWMNSNGVALIVESSIPLHVSINESASQILCIRSDYTNYPYPNLDFEVPVLKYKICKDDTLKKIHQYITDKHLDLPSELPDVSIIKSPVWSTWAKFRNNIDQKVILQLAREIKDYELKYDNSVFEINGAYSSAFGNFDFKSNTFKNSHQMLSILREYGYQAVVSITLFIGMESREFRKSSDFWLQDYQGTTPSLVKLYNGMASIVDVTNTNAAVWYLSHLKQMVKEYNLKSFYLHGCESNYLPSVYKTYRKLDNPSLFSSHFISNISEIGQKMVQISCPHNLQKYSLYTVLGSRESHWGKNNGLASVIPATLTLGIVGYPYVIPDVIGGNGVFDNETHEIIQPDKELFIRWMQMSSGLLVMKFSFLPWDYDSEVVKIAKKFIKFRQEKIIPVLLKAVREAELTGAPVIRPLWWNSPTDISALECDSQFLVGDLILVAPILQEGVHHRNVYLPDGIWFDEIHKKKEKGRRWLMNYKVDIDEIAVFFRSKTAN